MKYTYIYILIDPRTNAIRYVGKTDDCDRRLDGHIRESKYKINHKSNWIKSLLKENLKPIMEIIDEVPELEWEFWEKHYISLYKSWGCNLLNCTEGGEGGTMSTEILKIIAQKSTGNTNWLGKPRSVETKDKLRIKAKEQFKDGMPKETKEKIRIGNTKRMKSIIQFDFCGNLIQKWDSIMDASKKLNITFKNIQSACHGRQKSAGGFIWILKNDMENNPNILEEKKKSVNQKRKKSTAATKQKQSISMKKRKSEYPDTEEKKLKIWLSNKRAYAMRAVKLFNSFYATHKDNIINKKIIKRIKTA